MRLHESRLMSRSCRQRQFHATSHREICTSEKSMQSIWLRCVPAAYLPEEARREALSSSRSFPQSPISALFFLCNLGNIFPAHSTISVPSPTLWQQESAWIFKRSRRRLCTAPPSVCPPHDVCPSSVRRVYPLATNWMRTTMQRRTTAFPGWILVE